MATKLIGMSDYVEPETFHLDATTSSLKAKVKRFFKGETDKKGQPFKDEDIFTPARMDMMLNLDWEVGVDVVYAAINCKTTPEQKRVLDKNGKVEPDIELMLKCLYKTAACKIPMRYRIGVVATYVELKYKKKVSVLWEEFKTRLEEAVQVA